MASSDSRVMRARPSKVLRQVNKTKSYQDLKRIAKDFKLFFESSVKGPLESESYQIIRTLFEQKKLSCYSINFSGGLIVLLGEGYSVVLVKETKQCDFTQRTLTQCLTGVYAGKKPDKTTPNLHTWHAVVLGVMLGSGASRTVFVHPKHRHLVVKVGKRARCSRWGDGLKQNRNEYRRYLLLKRKKDASHVAKIHKVSKSFRFLCMQRVDALLPNKLIKRVSQENPWSNSFSLTRIVNVQSWKQHPLTKLGEFVKKHRLPDVHSSNVGFIQAKSKGQRRQYLVIDYGG